jgi:hypothetical protein
VKKTTLIAPFDDPLALAIAGEARVQGRTVAALLPGTGARKPAAPDAPEDRPIFWNPPSYVSARAAVLEAVVRFGPLDEAVFVAAPVAAPGLAAKPAELERFLHERVLAAFWLARELMSHFSERRRGRLVFVLADRGQSPREPAAAAAFGALEAFAASLTEGLQDAPYDIWTVRDSCPQDDLAAQYVSKLLDASGDRKAGHVLKYTGKVGIFNRI